MGKTKFPTITAVLATIAAIAALGSIGGGIGLGQQQTALAQVLDSSDIGGDEADLGVLEDIVREIGQDDNDNGGGEAPVNICGLRLANCEAPDLEAALEAANAEFVCQFVEFIQC
jgi:hypothetical protein